MAWITINSHVVSISATFNMVNLQSASVCVMHLNLSTVFMQRLSKPSLPEASWHIRPITILGIITLARLSDSAQVFYPKLSGVNFTQIAT